MQFSEITKLRKQRKSLNSKQRTLRKNGNELGTTDAAELERVSTEASGLQKSLETIRKQSRQHTMIVNDHKLTSSVGLLTSTSQTSPACSPPSQLQLSLRVIDHRHHPLSLPQHLQPHQTIHRMMMREDKLLGTSSGWSSKK